MNAIKAFGIIGSLLLFYVLALSALSASSQVLPPDTTTEETRRSREGLWLIALSFFVILAILVWRAL